ncbi:hypothetical protein EV191_103269 [Tamaricihabitans halophyticus]|uniref:Secreted protein n=1 Tax=Tamaricihabitans halophyticus TaxID=1262583 RepID=A0A4R2R4C9_9PSEU|nr:hypothetical protein [Tamaricihabitans halophyticus]TCP54225.1 hypothetical protein EV191_103269 [Tamaricihabitans halophyticus]
MTGRSLFGKAFALLAGALMTLLLVAAPASATTTPEPSAAEPALVHATENNDCKLNVRTGPSTSYQALITLTCANYTTCVQADGDSPCAPYVVGEEYSCVGANNKQVTDNRWAEVAWRAPEKAYVAVACAAFRE